MERDDGDPFGERLGGALAIQPDREGQITIDAVKAASPRQLGHMLARAGVPGFTQGSTGDALRQLADFRSGIGDGKNLRADVDVDFQKIRDALFTGRAIAYIAGVGESSVNRRLAPRMGAPAASRPSDPAA